MQKKILIVEDDEDIVSYLKDIFRNLLGIKNVEFFSVYDEKSALELLKKESIDLITLDDYLICGHGRDILKKMSDEQRNKTIVFSYDIPF